MPTTTGAPYGPTGGAAGIRSNAGPRDNHTDFGALPFNDFTPGMTTSNRQIQITQNFQGGRFLWRTGTHRLTTTLTYSLATAGQEHRFEPGAIVKGSSLLGAFTRGTGSDFDKWFITGVGAQFSQTEVTVDYPLGGTALRSLYVDDVMLYPIGTRAGVSGTTDRVFYEATSGGTFWIGFNPAGHLCESLFFFGQLFDIHAPDIVMWGGTLTHSGFSVIRVGGTAGITQANQPSNCVFQDMEMSYNRRQQCFSANAPNQTLTTPRVQGLVIDHCYIHHGANYNYSMVGVDDIDIRNTEMAFGNFLHFGDRLNDQFAEGNDKILFTNRARIRSNWIHDADGAASWPDTQNNTFTLEDNVLEDNFGSCIHLEDNSGAVLRRNYIANNQKDGNQPAPFQTLGGWGYRGGGMFLSSTNGAEVYDNDFYDNKHAEIYMRGDAFRVYNLSDTEVHHNRFQHWDSDSSAFEFLLSYRDSVNTNDTRPASGPRGLPAYMDSPYRDDANNVYHHNEYHVRGAGRSDNGGTTWFFAPSGSQRTYAQWQAGMATLQDPSGVAVGAVAAKFDPTSTFVADLPLFPGGPQSVQPVTETDLSRALVTKESYALAQVSETDTPLGVSAAVTLPVGVTQVIAEVFEDDSAQTASPRTRINFSNQAVATTFATIFTRVARTVVEIDSALGFGTPGVPLNIVEEPDEVFAVTYRQRLDWSTPVAATTANEIVVTPDVTLALGQPTSTASALAITVKEAWVLNQATETDETFAILKAISGGVTGTPAVAGNAFSEEPRVPVQRPSRVRVRGSYSNDRVR